MQRSAPQHHAGDNRAADRRGLQGGSPQTDTFLLQLVMLLACLVPALIAFSTALAQEQFPTGDAKPAEGTRGWIEPAATAAPVADPGPGVSRRPATLRLPHEAPTPISGSRIPDLPPAADYDTALIRSFTSSIQPLLLNRCAAGKCHGVNTIDTDTAAPQFQRQSIRGTVNREMTLRNIEALTAAVLPDFDTRRLLGPAGRPHGGASLPPLSPPQLHRLNVWIDAALAQQATWGRVQQASLETPLSASGRSLPQTAPAAPTSAAENNRFQRMLDDAANPQPLPPPQEPQGIIPLDDLPEAQPEAD